MGKDRKVKSKDREFGCSRLDSLAKELKRRIPSLTFRDINKLIHELVDDSV